jgi:hypothetical protein
MDETHRDEILRRPFGLVARIREFLELNLAAVRAGDGHRQAPLGQLVIRVSQFGRPEADRPAVIGAHGRAGYD